MEAAGQRMAAYLRRLPMAERKRHALVLEVLDELAQNTHKNPTEAQASAMDILRELICNEQPVSYIQPGPKLIRKHMIPEEMDRRPWVGAFFKLWRPIWIMAANFFNMSYLGLLYYALLLAGLYVLEKPSLWITQLVWQWLMEMTGAVITS